MKIEQPLSLFIMGAALIVTTSQAQTTPTGTATSTTYPQGAIAPDSTSGKSARNQKRAMKRSRRMKNQNSGNTGTTNASMQDAGYRKSSSSDGTAINNSNTTNYNSNNVTNAPTGVGSNPNESGTTTAQPASTNMGQSKGTTTPDAGAAEAISGAKTSETPAVKAGSTVRNTSIGDFIASSPNYTTLQNALQSANLFETLKGTGPYTIFAPSNNAFKKLSSTAQGALLDGSNRTALQQLLSYHVVNGSLTSAELSRQIKAGNGKAQLKTLSGTALTIQESNGHMTLTDEQGQTASVDAIDNRQANGAVYGIDTVLMPKTGMNAFR